MKMRQNKALLAFIFIEASVVLVGAQQGSRTANNRTIEYRNAKYGFSFRLPSSWKGYQVLWSTWGGYFPGEDRPPISGPMLKIRSPRWRVGQRTEDIPVMIYTLAQWRENPVVSAAGVGPNELGRNSQYVFATPPRWDYDQLAGFREAERIVYNHALRTFSPAGK